MELKKVNQIKLYLHAEQPLKSTLLSKLVHSIKRVLYIDTSVFSFICLEMHFLTHKLRTEGKFSQFYELRSRFRPNKTLNPVRSLPYGNKNNIWNGTA